MRDICSALAYMHSCKPQPVLHRDIKPENILLDIQGRVWLIDFGLSKSASLQLELTEAQHTQGVGTLGYMPPEQLRGVTEPRSDVYALAGTLHTLLTGFEPKLTLADLEALRVGQPIAFPPVRQRSPMASHEVEALILRAMSPSRKIAHSPRSFLSV